MANIVVSNVGTLGEFVPLIEIAHSLVGRGHAVRCVFPRQMHELAGTLDVVDDGVPIDYEISAAVAREPDAHARVLDRARMSNLPERCRVLAHECAHADLLLCGSRHMTASLLFGFSKIRVVGIAFEPAQFAHPQSAPVLAPPLPADVHVLASSSYFSVPYRPLYPALRVTGFVIPRSSPNELTADADDFLSSGDAPVLLYLGSLRPAGQEDIVAAVVGAAASIGLRTIVQTRWLTSSDESALRDRLERDEPRAHWHLTGWQPHGALMPRIRVAIHPGSMGTTAAALTHGRPAILLPSRVEHRFNAAFVHHLGVGTGMEAHGLRADDLAPALERCALGSTVERRAQTLRDKLATDNGRGAIPALVDHVLEANATRPRPAPPGASPRPSSGHGRRRLILFYNGFFPFVPPWEPPDLSSLDPPYETSTDCSLLAHAAAVVFHMPTLTELPRIRKLAGQRWVAWSMESEINYPVLASHRAMRHFEVTMTYRLDSTVPTLYFGESGYRSMYRPAPDHPEPALASLFVSSSVGKQRADYLRELVTHMRVDSYGRFLNNRTLADDRGLASKLAAIGRHRFNLAFENTRVKDYVTEKFFDALTAGTVPIYWGAPNIADFAPSPHSYVDASQFPEPRDLAAFVTTVAESERDYAAYHSWRDAPPTAAVETLLARLPGPSPFATLATMLERDDDRLTPACERDHIPFPVGIVFDGDRVGSTRTRSRRTDPEPSAPDRLKKVISFSLWGSNPRYTLGAIANADLAAEVYPGWICRFYVANDVPAETMAQLGRRDNVELVAAQRQGDWRGLFWRFRCAGDRSVDVMISRDADSRLGYREKAAVDEWLASDRDFHIMRDHALHGVHILGGMWGARNHVIADIGAWLDSHAPGNFWQADQIFLAHEVYPRIANNCLVHDEFFWRTGFPRMPRDANHFVGQVYAGDGRLADGTPFRPYFERSRTVYLASVEHRRGRTD